MRDDHIPMFYVSMTEAPKTFLKLLKFYERQWEIRINFGSYTQL